jgi:hypothetical protein
MCEYCVQIIFSFMLKEKFTKFKKSDKFWQKLRVNQIKNDKNKSQQSSNIKNKSNKDAKTTTKKSPKS